jgi:DNA-binding MarR family transcriptional regulator
MSKSGIVQALELCTNSLEIDTEMSVTTLAIFLTVCMKEGITNSDVEEVLGIPKARVSRNLQLLTKIAKRRVDNEGSNLIEMKINPEDYRRRNLYLTNRGKSFRDKITKLLG